MEKEIAVVTGASSGFGLLTSLEFAKRGYMVIATMRDLAKSKYLLEQADLIGCSEHIQIHELDVTSEDSVSQFKSLIDRLERVDVLVNNAGYASAGFVEEIPISEYRKQFETNFFGLIMVTQVCIPFMRDQRKGTIINVSSISGLMGFPSISPYVASKHALEGWSECLRLELKPFGVNVSLVEPGSFKTNIWSTGKEITEKSLMEHSPYYFFMRKMEEHIQKGESQFGDPQEVAKKIVDIAQHPNPNLRYPIGKGVSLSLLIKRMLPWSLWERIFLKKLT